MRNLRLDMCYDGTRYRGWQRLKGEENTVQGKLEQTLTRILGEPVTVSGSGRTDAGAHALGQVVSFSCESKMPCGEILAALRRYLPEDLGIYSCQEAPPRFHARLSAREKTYCYRIWNSDAPCVFQRRYVWIRPGTLDTAAMERGAKCLLGKHDFSAFCTARPGKKSTVRTLTALELCQNGAELDFTVRGDGFLYNMVRILVGTLLEVGEGKRTPESLADLFGRPRAEAGPLVPAQGLCLMEVRY